MLKSEDQRARFKAVEFGAGWFISGGSEGLRFEGGGVHSWVQSVLCRQEYQRQDKAARGLLSLYLQKMTGLSRAQVTRLIARYAVLGQVHPARCLRHSERYREGYLHYEKTRPTRVAIGERRKPEPRGEPGFLRIDTVHQGDQWGDQPDSKGLYHINAVDEVTQWQIMASVPRISEAIYCRCWRRCCASFLFAFRTSRRCRDC